MVEASRMVVPKGQTEWPLNKTGCAKPQLHDWTCSILSHPEIIISNEGNPLDPSEQMRKSGTLHCGAVGNPMNVRKVAAYGYLYERLCMPCRSDR
ncbi:hypothetical protein AB6A40_010816 [Gnathostoma spinigerum]|uniref:Uncharacterized protein n=1 Tax=Gnathostoma spinigerum TaxID=75299 RepID=A0ABD6F343_9BILA